MVQYDKYILNKLLDTYESSLLSTGENRRNIHIEFRFTKASLPTYFDESSQEYEQIHLLMDKLQGEGLIEICWKGKKQGHIISKVRMNMERLEQVYAYVRRVPGKDMTDRHRQLLEECLEQKPTPVCRAFVEYLLTRLAEHKSVKEFVGLQNPASTQRLLETIQIIEKNEEPLYIREFSIRHFQDSKAFENMEGRVLHVFRRFKENCETAAYKEILAEYDIYYTPDYVYLKGRAAFSVGEERIHLSVLKQGIGISGEDIGRVHFTDTAKVKKVITIENLTTYFRWQEEDGLLIYLGGYHNAVRRTLLQKIYACCPDAEYYHFGDIDAGGFEIYRDLREKTGIPFKMYKMDLETLQMYECYGKRLTESDRRRLQGMSDREEIQEVVRYMLEHDVKLEQECVRL